MRVISKVTAVLALLFFGACASAPVQTREAAPGARVTESGIAALEARMAGYVTDGQVRGIAARLIVDGEVVSDLTAGIRRASDGAPIEKDTIYRIYSMSKPITGVAMMMLYEEGAFTLDDPITKFVPEFAGLRVMTGVDADGVPILEDPARLVTLRDVMTHTAGFAYGLSGSDPANRAFREQRILSAPDLQTFIDQVASVPLLFQPGTGWAYSASVDIQGYLIQKISGQSFGNFLKTRLFDPLGMKDTGFYVPDAELGRLSDVFGYSQEASGGVALDLPQLAFRRDTVAMESGGGGLVSTMDDYTRFARMLLNEGELDGIRILRPETVRLMRTNMLPAGARLFSDGTGASNQTAGLAFGLGLGLIEDPAAGGRPQAAGSYFWGGAAGTWFWIDPSNNLIFIGMIQRFGQAGPAVDFRSDSATYVYEALVK